MFFWKFFRVLFFLLYILVWKVAQIALVSTTNVFISCLFVCFKITTILFLWKISLSYCVINQSCKLTVLKSTSCGVESSETLKIISSGNKYCSFSCGLVNPFHLQVSCFLGVCSLCWKVCTGELIYISSENWVIWCTIISIVILILPFAKKPMH